MSEETRRPENNASSDPEHSGDESTQAPDPLSPQGGLTHSAEDPSPDIRDRAAVLSDEDREWVRRTAESLGPLSDEQRQLLALLLRNP